MGKELRSEACYLQLRRFWQSVFTFSSSKGLVRVGEMSSQGEDVDREGDQKGNYYSKHRGQRVYIHEGRATGQRGV